MEPEFWKRGRQLLVLVKFVSLFRVYKGEVDKHAFKVAAKTQAYTPTMRHFRRQKGPGVEVLQQSYVMRCHGWWMCGDGRLG